MRKVQDHYFKRAKKEKYPARSVYKLEEVQNKYRVLKKGDAVLDLGCQPGSWSVFAARTVGRAGRVIGIDLQPAKNTSVAGGAGITCLQEDINSDSIVEKIQQKQDKFQVVLSDIAPRTTGNKWVDQQQSLRLARRVLDLTGRLLEAGGNFYVKVFEGEDFKEYVDSVRKSFKTVKIVKPRSSRSESREVFILGLGYKKDNYEL